MLLSLLILFILYWSSPSSFCWWCLILNDVNNISCSVLVLMILQGTGVGGAVHIRFGSGKFTRVHFKDNTATSVSNLLFSHNFYYTFERVENLAAKQKFIQIFKKHLFFRSFSFMEIVFWHIHSALYIYTMSLYLSLFLFDTWTDGWCSVHPK